MSGFAGVVDLAAMAWAAFLLATALASALLYPLARLRLNRLSAPNRVRAIALWAALPVIAGVLLTWICFLPSLLSLAGLMTDHCHEHDDGHPHMCLAHGPAETSFPGMGIAVAAGIPLLAALVRHIGARHRLGRVLSTLDVAGHHHRSRDIRVLHSTIPFAFAAFAVRPRIFVSSALTSSLPQQLLDAVIEHEQAHVRRRDWLVQSIASALSVFHVPWVRTCMLADLNLASEQACDEEAARRIGDPLCVASAILAVEKMFHEHSLPLPVSSFGGANIAPRVESLLRDAPPSAAVGRWAIRFALTLSGLVLAASDALHHATETVLSPLVR